MSTTLYFDRLYEQDDPFGYRHRWYETRKRDLTMAILPQPRFKRAWEIGCSNGETSAVLAERCSSLFATDLNARAVELTRKRVASSPHVRVEQANHPADWPDGIFDLIVFSEVGYYFEAAALKRTAQQFSDALTADGILLACHWLAPFPEARRTGEQVHEMLQNHSKLELLSRYRDADFLLEVWSPTSRSVAQMDGLR